MTIQGIIATLLIGLVAGWLASFVVGGGGPLKYIVWGILGAIVGGIVLPALGVAINLGSPVVNQIVVAAIGAVLLVLVARAIA
ncbi:GlsB/YeaQ/YmgE family stress response membrane protein [Limibaculum sp. FT325]|uniref:GlsB/YeaQ/YmgE family stress response membrane protein n=1 Tax=Thermohalobaculum sediminis TaxID=2939436 RepID=UPI0020C09FC3|nr:GlsB/YeaQ/YmgE family stress response membrane protein [Limibaculum sediminis]MCL5776686.1 GlsB/YeaQ/YmgE family stress response membrane protein [Limibaculum sediminis]